MPQQTAMANVTEIATILVPVMFVFRDLDGNKLVIVQQPPRS